MQTIKEGNRVFVNIERVARRRRRDGVEGSEAGVIDNMRLNLARIKDIEDLSDDETMAGKVKRIVWHLGGSPSVGDFCILVTNETAEQVRKEWEKYLRGHYDE